MPEYAPGGAPFAFPGSAEGTIGCLLIHGFTGMAKEMRPLGEYLAARGCSVVGVRLAGHGTTMADLQRTTWQDWVASAREGLLELRGRCPQVFIIGFSMGGDIALFLAARERVTGVISMSAPSRNPSQDWRSHYIRWFKYLKRYAAKGPSDWHDPVAAAQHVSYAAYPTRSAEQAMKVFTAANASLPQVRVPTLVMHSRDDGDIPLAHAHEIYGRLGSADKELVVIEGSGHVITEDAQREQVAARIWEWVQRHAVS